MRTHTHEITRALAAAALIALLAAPVRAVTTTAKTTSSAKSPAMVMPWIEDDYGKAITEAKARKVPIFVESWAPW
jgi:hypothetical protein